MSTCSGYLVGVSMFVLMFWSDTKRRLFFSVSVSEFLALFFAVTITCNLSLESSFAFHFSCLDRAAEEALDGKYFLCGLSVDG